MSRALKADLLLLFCTVVWGATFVLVKDALADSSVFVYLALRFAIAAVLLAIAYYRELRGLDLDGLRAGAVIGLCVFGGYGFQTAGIALTTPSKAAFITGVSVVLVPVFLTLFGRRRPQASVWAGAFSAFAGLYLLALPSARISGINLGDALVLCGAIMYALQIISVGHYTRRHRAGVLTLVQISITSALMIGSVGLLGALHVEAPRAVWSPTLISAVLITGVLGTAMAFAAQAWAQQYASASHTAILFTFEPVVAALTSFFFYHERMSSREIAGGALILGGILLAEMVGEKAT